MLKEDSGKIIDIVAENAPVAGCTVSHEVAALRDFHLSYFSLAQNTDISAESYQLPRLLLVAVGELTVYVGGNNAAQELRAVAGESVLLPTGVPVGMRSATGTVYVEFCFEEETTMNEVIKAGEVFKLKELLPYQPGKIVSMDVIHDEHLKFALMSFADGTGLTEHAAPGEALVFALDGTGIIGYEGQEYELKAGETFKFAKNGRHYVKAKGDFKMALLLMFEN